jgi:hypothetical protein
MNASAERQRGCLLPWALNRLISPALFLGTVVSSSPLVSMMLRGVAELDSGEIATADAPLIVRHAGRYVAAPGSQADTVVSADPPGIVTRSWENGAGQLVALPTGSSSPATTADWPPGIAWCLACRPVAASAVG